MDPTTKEAQMAAKLLKRIKAYAAHGHVAAVASQIKRLLKLDLDAVAKILEGAPVMPSAELDSAREAVQRYEKRLNQLAKLIPKEADTPRQRSGSIGGGFSKPWYQQNFPHKTCANCRRHFVPRNARAKTCSTKCRVALFRKRRQVRSTAI